MVSETTNVFLLDATDLAPQKEELILNIDNKIFGSGPRSLCDAGKQTIGGG